MTPHQFTDYVAEFYADSYQFTREEILGAMFFLSAWTDFAGDSVDRERVRDLIIWKRGGEAKDRAI